MVSTNNKKNLDKECMEKLCKFITVAPFLYVRENKALLKNILIDMKSGDVFSLHNNGKSQVLLYKIPKKYLPEVLTTMVGLAYAIGQGDALSGSPIWIGLENEYSARFYRPKYVVKNSLPKNPALTLMKLLERQK